jgi:hypothetical protein
VETRLESLGTELSAYGMTENPEPSCCAGHKSNPEADTQSNIAPLFNDDATGKQDWLSLVPVAEAPGAVVPVAEDDEVADRILIATEGAIWMKCEPVSLMQTVGPIGPHHPKNGALAIARHTLFRVDVVLGEQP